MVGDDEDRPLGLDEDRLVGFRKKVNKEGRHWLDDAQMVYEFNDRYYLSTYCCCREN